MSSQTTRNWLTTSFAAGLAVAVVALGAVAVTSYEAYAPKPAAAAAATPAVSVPGRGATVPFTQYEAENAATNGSVLARSRTAGTLASEGAGRSAVTLSGSGQYVDFTLTAAANAVNLHYSVPDTSNGSDYTTTIAVYVNGSKNRDLTLTNRFSWFYGSYPFTNDPGDGKPHHFYDDVRTMFGSTLAAGTHVRFQRDSSSVPITVDTAEFENVAAPIGRPANSLLVTDYGADPSGAADSGSAIQNAVNAASSQGRVLYVPQGTYTVNQHIIVNNVTIQGAGQWYSVLHGNGVGVYGNYAPNPSSNVHLQDFAIFGETTDRNDGAQVNAIGGALGGGSVVDHVWMQHTKVGLWLDGPFDGLTVRNCRILDQTADGLNLHNGISNTTVTQNYVRNTGDDGLAMWSDQNADHNNTFSWNTVELPILANNIAIYGGRDISVTDNVVSDTQTQGGGLHVANRFNSVVLAGTITVARNTTLRAGVLDPNWQFGVGALWFDALNGNINATINVTDTDLLDSSYEGIQWVEGGSITGVSFNNVRIDGAGTFALQIQTSGSASFTNVTAAHIGYSNPIYSCMGTSFTINQGSGNSGWYTANPYCGGWPPPVYTYPGNPTSPPPTTQPPTEDPNANLALGKSMTASGYTQVYGPANANDGNANSYWESVNNSFPQWLQADLGSATNVGRIVLKLPPSTAWGTRTQTLSVTGSTDGSNFSSVVGSESYTFNPATGNTATITFSARSLRYLRLSFTANTGWPAGQAAEFEIYHS
ncbi:discoidin domain-containing protein [Fodinicola acaciae]|uniref:discoidin domain-containing protein n=1 Tax=Fodinicola acaciae TaxID=2681555 RepID=UPI0013D25313|nr:discoidin domain-containing protein [Fodinicola acaciae]